MTEKQIESYLRDQIKSMGGRAYKFESPGNSGVPDRLIVMPNNKIFFAELKTEKGVLSACQRQQIKFLQSLDCSVVVLRSKTEVDYFVKEVLQR